MVSPVTEHYGRAGMKSVGGQSWTRSVPQSWAGTVELSFPGGVHGGVI